MTDRANKTADATKKRWSLRAALFCFGLAAAALIRMVWNGQWP